MMYLSPGQHLLHAEAEKQRRVEEQAGMLHSCQILTTADSSEAKNHKAQADAIEAEHVAKAEAEALAH